MYPPKPRHGRTGDPPCQVPEASIQFSEQESFSAEDSESGTFELRMARKEELIRISRCIYDEYGYSYPNDSFYYIERLAAMIEAGQLYPFVCVADEGEVAAVLHIDMREPQCPCIFESAVRNGFVFSGVLPNSGDGERILMNHLMGKAINYDRITTIDTCGDIPDHIKAHDTTRL